MIGAMGLGGAGAYLGLVAGVHWLSLSEPACVLLLQLHHVCPIQALRTWCGRGHCMSRLS